MTESGRVDGSGTGNVPRLAISSSSWRWRATEDCIDCRGHGRLHGFDSNGRGLPAETAARRLFAT